MSININNLIHNKLSYGEAFQ